MGRRGAPCRRGLVSAVLLPALAVAGLLGDLLGGGLGEVSLTQPTSVLDCAVSDWGTWSACSESCGTGGQQQSTRSIVREPVVWQGGKPCPHVMRLTRSCLPAPVACPAVSAAATTAAPCTGTACVCACVAQSAEDGADWSSACAEACGERVKHVAGDVRAGHFVATQLHHAQVAHHAAAAVSSQSDENSTHTAQIRLQQAPGDATRLQVMVSNTRRFAGFRFAVANGTGAAAPVGAAQGGQAAAKGFGMSTNAAQGTVLGFSELPTSQFEATPGAVGEHYQLLTELALRDAATVAGYASWYAFSPRLCVSGVVLSDGDGGAISAGNSCSTLQNPNTPAPTPLATAKPTFVDFTLRFAGATSHAFDAHVRGALRQAVSTALMRPLADVYLDSIMPGGTDDAFYVDAHFTVAAHSLLQVQDLEAHALTDEASFVDTVLDRLFAQGVRVLVLPGANSRLTVHRFQVTGTPDSGAPATTAAASRDCRYVWSDWSKCSVLCGGGGSQTRHAVVVNGAIGMGAGCPVSQTRDCGNRACQRTRSPTPSPTPPPTPPSPPTPPPTMWYDAVPTGAPTPRPTRAGEVYTQDTCTHTICRVLKSVHDGKKVHVIRVMHAEEESAGTRHRCMYNDEMRSCICRCSTSDADLCPLWNPDCMHSGQSESAEMP